MRIENLRVNHIEYPMGYEMNRPVFSWVTAESSGKTQKTARIRVARDQQMKEILYDTGEIERLCPLGEEADIILQPRTRYYWQVAVTADDGEQGLSETAWFETGKRDEKWEASWITTPFPMRPVMHKSFDLECEPVSARLYICGLGLYEAELNGARIGDEFLTPGFTSYQKRIQYQTYDVTDSLITGENRLNVRLGDGWYLGRFGFGDVADTQFYGDRYQLIAELRILLGNGKEITIGTDESWSCSISPVLEGNLYDGETYDARLENDAAAVGVMPAEPPEGKLCERIGVPVKTGFVFRDYELIRSPKEEWILDFGQNMSGWASFTCRIPEGRKIVLQYGEILQKGCFYRENLRSAKQEFSYISNGDACRVRPCFTIFGFRYVKVEGMTGEEIRESGFVAEAVWSDIAQTGTIETSDEKLNRLIKNVLWGQRSNFVDIPTDCPQRDERMGWTGDAQVFSAAACYNMYTPAFYNKYLTDMLTEQRELDGSVPFVVPDIYSQHNRKTGYIPSDRPFDKKSGSCGWGDAATVIPWNLYLFYGDRTLLRRHYPNMKLWVEYIRKQDDGSRLWQTGFHFADWLAMDGPDPRHSMGGTDPYYVASAYYYLSVSLTARAARELNEDADAEIYTALAGEIRSAIQQRYFTPDGSLTVQTQTAHVLALNLGLAPEDARKRIAERLQELIDKRGGHLDTGFLGTCQICQALSKSGMTDTAYDLLFNEEYPGWLYQVNLGATTVWERWNSVMPDGSVSSTGMNSMNHYANGAVLQWIYETAGGLSPAAPGFQRARIAPQPAPRLSWVCLNYESAAGHYQIVWERRDDRIHYTVEVPFGAEVEFIFPKSRETVILAPGRHVLAE